MIQNTLIICFDCLRLPISTVCGWTGSCGSYDCKIHFRKNHHGNLKRQELLLLSPKGTWHTQAHSVRSWVGGDSVPVILPLWGPSVGCLEFPGFNIYW